MQRNVINWGLSAFAAIALLFWVISIWWSQEPDVMNIDELSKPHSKITGYPTSTALIEVASTLLNKPGGFLANDVMPPSVFLDNMPAWEFGVLEQVRDLALAMRKDFSRSQSQSQEDIDLKFAQPQFNIDHTNWAWPSAEGEYANAIAAVERYRARLIDDNQSDAQFYSRADNLRDWLKEVEKRLGSTSQKLSASVGQKRFNTNLAGDNAASQSTYAPMQQNVKTNWWKIDDVFYEARGTCWALLHFLKAVEVDFADVLEKKNAQVSLRQIIRELEATQQTVWSPMILNGDGFGFLANHSLVMANYVSRANAAVIDLRELMAQG
ncbi:hypothetical protein DS2_03855 [Catenovulum agarivorans DS-2]|uniref:Uncharacterized protein n=1 Tax=Catenovulum agarivorans DS-2 TaxID=1328313 RepID=W7QV75_9ALTE|nr:DUF2333 family protein [Catenovulum agarivorans]EWH11613.1 hypothetical protein DS2_03855 [Catenovulum agarivorans DS-2]